MEWSSGGEKGRRMSRGEEGSVEKKDKNTGEGDKWLRGTDDELSGCSWLCVCVCATVE